MTQKALTLSLVLIISVFSSSQLAADKKAGAKLYQHCVQCHGDSGQGNRALDAPALAGQQASYLVRTLKHYQSGVRGSDPGDSNGQQMRAMVATLQGDKAIEQVAAYIAALPPTYSNEKVSGDVHRGNNLYHGNCGACHGNRAQGSTELNAPRLAGLDAVYIARQVEYFKNGVRGSHAKDRYGKQMAMMVTDFSSQDLNDVLAYIYSQPEAK